MRNNQVVVKPHISKGSANSRMTPNPDKLLKKGKQPPPPAPPTVSFTPLAAEKIRYMVKKYSAELGWACLTCPHPTQHDPLIQPHHIIVDVEPIPDQEVSGASVEFKAEDEGKAFDELILRLPMLITRNLIPLDPGTGKPMPVTTNAYGHSHVNMGVSPSSTDDDHMMEIGCEYDAGEKKWVVTGRYPHYIQTIHNKKGDTFAAIFDFENALHWDECKVSIYNPSPLTKDDEDHMDKVMDTFVTGFNRAAYGGWWDSWLGDRNPHSSKKTKTVTKIPDNTLPVPLSPEGWYWEEGDEPELDEMRHEWNAKVRKIGEKKGKKREIYMMDDEFENFGELAKWFFKDNEQEGEFEIQAYYEPLPPQEGGFGNVYKLTRVVNGKAVSVPAVYSFDEKVRYTWDHNLELWFPESE